MGIVTDKLTIDMAGPSDDRHTDRQLTCGEALTYLCGVPQIFLMTTVSLPDGYLSRSEAAKGFNRSQRSLERDIDAALRKGDRDVLAHWRLVTKDGTIRLAQEVSLEEADRLMAEGMVPTWCVSEEWLLDRFGRKGEMPRRQIIEDNAAKTAASVKDAPAARQEPDSPAAHNDQPSGAKPPEPDYIEFLKRRIETLERERREEAERNENRETKLFEQLATKDAQISRWDEVTQGLTKALATGQLAPALQAGAPTKEPQPTSASVKSETELSSTPTEDTLHATDDGKRVIESTVTSEAASGMKSPSESKNRTTARRAPRKQPKSLTAKTKDASASTGKGSQPRKKTKKQSEEKPEEQETAFQKHLPTLHKAFFRFNRDKQ